MNERWKYTQKFKGDDMVLIALELDGCFTSLEELRGFGNSRFFKTALPAEYVDNKRQFEMSQLSKEKIKAINFDAKSMADSICQALDAINELDDNDFDVPFGYVFPNDITCSKKALYYWLKQLNLTDIAEQFYTVELAESSQDSDSKSRLNESEYWNKFEKMAENAIDKYPAWKSNKDKGNVDLTIQWLKDTGIVNNTREAEVIKNILSDLFDLVF